MSKQQLLQQLSTDTWVALQPSSVHGIGVFAIRDIPKGCRTIFSDSNAKWIPVSFAEVEQLPEHSRNLIETYCLYDEENYFVPEYGFKMMDVVLYLNHSSTPNLQSINEGEFFEALVDIPAGAELFIDYGTVVDGVDYE